MSGVPQLPRIFSHLSVNTLRTVLALASMQPCLHLWQNWAHSWQPRLQAAEHVPACAGILLKFWYATLVWNLC